MSWFFEMREKYAPTMAPLAFDDFINKLEEAIFDEHPEYIQLSEEEQNKIIEAEIRKNIQ